MLWPVVLATFFLATSLSALPVEPETEVSPSTENLPTLATDLVPPPPPNAEDSDKKPVLFLINLFGVKNETGDEDVLQDDILSDHPDIAAPLASILLVVEADDEDTPVSLDEVSKDLENEGFKVEQIKGKDGEIKAVKVDINLDDIETPKSSEEEKEDETVISRALRRRRETGQKSIERIRRKRHLCLKCKLHDLHGKLHGGYGGYGGGGCGSGNCGGGGYGGGGYGGGGYGGGRGHGGYGGNQGCTTCGGGYQPRPPRPVCNTCGGGGYPQGGGGRGGGYSQASAQASASASAQSSSNYY